MEGDDSVGLAVDLNNGHSVTFSGDPREAMATKGFREHFGRRSSDKSCRPELYTSACGRRERTRGGGFMTRAPAGDGVKTCGPRCGKETDRWVPRDRNSRIKINSKWFPVREK
jgi:hypothetical protein